jgi:hypothetical protein
MISDDTFPRRLTKIDELSRPDHSYLTPGDECYFLGEYTARKGFGFSSTNHLIYNLKKTVDRRGRPEWRYKEQAIKTAAQAFRASLSDAARETFTFVPVPPSRAKTDPLYDDRLVQVLRGIWPGLPVDLRELIVQPHSTEAIHGSDDRPTPNQLVARYVLDDQLLNPAPQAIAIVDDVITTGSHFVAVRSMLRQAFPAVRIVGLFIARRVPEAVDFEDLDLPDA